MAKSDLVVKTNYLNTVLQNLNLTEIRIIQLAIIDARETGKGLDAQTPLRISAIRYAEAFNTTRQNGYLIMKEAEETLFNRRFSFLDEDERKVKSRWISQAKYLDDEGAIEVVFTPAVVKGITRIDGAEEFFTQYLLEQTARMDSNYSVRLYELLVQWKKLGKTPLFELEQFRGQMGLGINEYKRMCDLKRRVLELAINEINEKSDLKVTYDQQKKGRKIVGFSFIIKQKKLVKKNETRDPNTIDWVNGVTDNEVRGMNLAQAQKYAEKLHREHGIVNNWNGSYNDAKFRLIKELQQPEYVRKYMLYLLNCDDPFDPKTVGFG